MESHYRNHHSQTVPFDMTIVPIICKLKEDFDNLFEYEKDWNYVWELM